ncbi:hypothetical protein G5S52_17750, partial [Grimontia sp. S25]
MRCVAVLVGEVRVHGEGAVVQAADIDAFNGVRAGAGHGVGVGAVSRRPNAAALAQRQGEAVAAAAVSNGQRGHGVQAVGDAFTQVEGEGRGLGAGDAVIVIRRLGGAVSDGDGWRRDGVAVIVTVVTVGCIDNDVLLGRVAVAGQVSDGGGDGVVTVRQFGLGDIQGPGA